MKEGSNSHQDMLKTFINVKMHPISDMLHSEFREILIRFSFESVKTLLYKLSTELKFALSCKELGLACSIQNIHHKILKIIFQKENPSNVIFVTEIEFKNLKK